MRNLKIAIVGDILHSRVARSNIILHQKLGNRISLIGPPSLVPREFEKMGATVYHDMRAGIEDANVVMMLRVQEERGARNYFPSIREYRSRFAITRPLFALAHRSAILLHPGPINRDVEIDTFMADADESAILQQVTNGIAVRMAVLYLLKGEIHETLA